jgi:putative ATPase
VRPRTAAVPLRLRNAPTRLMKDLGYGEGYRYAHDEQTGVAEMESLPEGLRGRRYYEPSERGAEVQIAARLEAARLVRGKKTSHS